MDPVKGRERGGGPAIDLGEARMVEYVLAPVRVLTLARMRRSTARRPKITSPHGSYREAALVDLLDNSSAWSGAAENLV